MTAASTGDSQVRRELSANGREEFARHFESVRHRLKKIVAFRLDYRLRGRVSESDILQETFVRAAGHLDRFVASGDMPFFVWLRMELQQGICEAHRRHLGADKRDVRREHRFQPGDPGQTSMALAACLAGQMTSASRALERAEMIETLERALEEIPAIDREVIALRHFEELSNLETARILDIEPAAASKRYLRALQRMRQIFDSLQPEHGP
jgi:RNA polymerase sigma-70 factor (ECF subfamily)